ncbi:hypothetical protein SK128_009010 [Halocaridina rubra]|uniref:Uncharacterized protein n=1 Tax=Halocaridina rubra TaxID=373956 RepID=A0AAN8X324_HALRR
MEKKAEEEHQTESTQNIREPLQAPRTSPVSLPERLASPNQVQDSATGGVCPSTPSPTHSMMSQRGHSVPPVIMITYPNGHSFVAYQPPHQSLLDIAPPLLPETTTTARQAAVMSQFSNPQIQGGDTDDAPPRLQYSRRRLHECPMCDYVVPPGAVRLLEEHLNSHLKHVCPVCAMRFHHTDNKR